MKYIFIFITLLFIAWILWVNSINTQTFQEPSYHYTEEVSFNSTEENTDTTELSSVEKTSYRYEPPEHPFYLKEKEFKNNHLPFSPKFKCDGREYCSQMHSCEEATYFINHCPNTKMDGDNDGIPCERQWCSH